MTGSVDRGRVRATWLLAESCLDHLPQARQPSSTLGALPGLAVSRRVPCTGCGARGRLRAPGVICASCSPQTDPERDAPRREAYALHGCYACPLCEGTGWRRRRKSDPEIDSYAGVEIPTTAEPEDVSVGAIREALQAQRERPEIGYDALARATHAVEAAERPESEMFGWERAWERMCQVGSYAELRVALELLRMKQEGRYSIVWQIVCLQQPITLSDGRTAFLNESMVELTVYMPDTIRVPRWLRDDVRAEARKTSLWHGKSPAHARERCERDEEIRQLKAEGMKLGQLQRRFALSKAQILRICAKEPA